MSDEFARLTSLPEFLAHAMALEGECEERLLDLSRCMRSHNNPQAAEIFERAEGFRRAHLQQLKEMARELQLPRVAPWEHIWHQTVNMEWLCISNVHYLITAGESLSLVLEKLSQTRLFYERVLENVEHPDIRRAAQQIIATIERELDKTRAWRQQLEQHRVADDLDPPNMPE